MPEIKFTTFELNIVRGALRVAAEQYGKDADIFRESNARITEQFEAQKSQALQILENLNEEDF